MAGITVSGTGDLNLRRYAVNSPTNFTDPDGQYILARNRKAAIETQAELRRWGYSVLIGALPSGRYYVHVPAKYLQAWEGGNWNLGTGYYSEMQHAAFSWEKHVEMFEGLVIQNRPWSLRATDRKSVIAWKRKFEAMMTEAMMTERPTLGPTTNIVIGTLAGQQVAVKARFVTTIGGEKYYYTLNPRAYALT